MEDLGEYFVMVVNIYGCWVESEVVEVLEGLVVSLVLNGCYMCCVLDIFCFFIILNIVSYQWFQDGVVIFLLEGIVFNLIIMENGSYILQM